MRKKAFACAKAFSLMTIKALKTLKLKKDDKILKL